MEVDFFDSVNLILAFQVLLLASVILQKGYGRISNRLLAFFLFSESLGFLNTILYHDYEYFARTVPFLFYWTSAITFIWGPTIYLFVLTELKEIKKLRANHWAHFLPAIAITIYFIINFHSLSFDDKVVLLLEYPIMTWENGMFLTGAMMIQLVIYNGLSLYEMWRHSKLFKSNAKQINSRLTLVKFVLIGYIIACIAYNINIAFLQKSQNYLLSKYITLAIFSAYFMAILYKFLLTNEFVKELPKKLRSNKDLSEEAFIALANRLESYVQEKKPYLEAGLTLSRLAKMMKVKERNLSIVINENYSQNFQEYINSFRIKYAQDLLINSDDQKLTVQELVYAVGFNSKTAFYVSFKKATGLTPRAFKNQNLVQV